MSGFDKIDFVTLKDRKKEEIIPDIKDMAAKRKKKSNN